MDILICVISSLMLMTGLSKFGMDFASRAIIVVLYDLLFYKLWWGDY